MIGPFFGPAGLGVDLKKSTLIAFRCPDHLLEKLDLAILTAIDKRRWWKKMSRSQFILRCLREVLAKPDRARKSKARAAARRKEVANETVTAGET